MEKTPFEVKIGAKKVVGTGSLLVYGNEAVEFHLFDGPPMVARVSLVSDTDFGDNKIKGEKISSTEVSVSLINFTNPLGSGSRRLMQVGTIGDQALFFGFWIVGSPEQVRMLHYTWAVGPTEKVVSEESTKKPVEVKK